MARTAHDSVVGKVEVWHDDEGWGVLRTPDGLSVFCHFSSVEGEGFRRLLEGLRVWFDYEVPGQDGCDARVLTAARAGDADPAHPLGTLVGCFAAPGSQFGRESGRADALDRRVELGGWAAMTLVALVRLTYDEQKS
jgi:CspA family cold shock protein